MQGKQGKKNSADVIAHKLSFGQIQFIWLMPTFKEVDSAFILGHINSKCMYPLLKSALQDFLYFLCI